MTVDTAMSRDDARQRTIDSRMWKSARTAVGRCRRGGGGGWRAAVVEPMHGVFVHSDDMTSRHVTSPVSRRNMTSHERSISSTTVLFINRKEISNILWRDMVMISVCHCHIMSALLNVPRVVDHCALFKDVVSDLAMTTSMRAITDKAWRMLWC